MSDVRECVHGQCLCTLSTKYVNKCLMAIVMLSTMTTFFANVKGDGFEWYLQWWYAVHPYLSFDLSTKLLYNNNLCQIQELNKISHQSRYIASFDISKIVNWLHIWHLAMLVYQLREDKYKNMARNSFMNDTEACRYIGYIIWLSD